MVLQDLNSQDQRLECGSLITHLVDTAFQRVINNNFGIPFDSNIKSVKVNPSDCKSKRTPGTLEIETIDDLTIIFDLQYSYSNKFKKTVSLYIRNDPHIWKIIDPEYILNQHF